ncbi:hypothetical protein KCU86_g52, partial [Aureobasidium melanogenum]
MSADSPHEIIRCEPSSRDGFAAKPENNNRRIRGGLILETYRRASLDHLHMTLDLKREICLVTVITEEERDPDGKRERSSMRLSANKQQRKNTIISKMKSGDLLLPEITPNRTS